MRLRNMAAVLSTATLLVGLLAAPAAAGTGWSQACTDGVGWLWRGINDPITVGIEVSQDPLNTNVEQVWVCYSTTAYGSPNDGIVGGAFRVDVAWNTSTTNPGAGVGFLCLGDDSPAIGSLNCFAGTGVTTSPFDVRTVPAGGVCVLSVNGACAFYLNGLAVYTNNTPAPLIELVVNSSLTGYLPFPVNAPAQCIGVLAPC